MEWDHYSYKIAEHYLPALINGDYSGMTEAEVSEFDAWQADAQDNAHDAGFTVGHWAAMPDAGDDWGRCDASGLFATRCEVRLMVRRP